MQQQQAVRMELERLARTLEALLAEHEVDEDSAEDESVSGIEKEVHVPGLERLLLGGSSDSMPTQAKEEKSGLPELKL